MQTRKTGIDKTAYLAMILLLLFFLGMLYLKNLYARDDAFAMIGSPAMVDRDLLLISNYQTLQSSELGRDLELLDYESSNLDEAVRTAAVAAAPVAARPRANVPSDYYAPFEHRVREGESLWSIARTYGVSGAAIASVNNWTGSQQSVTVGQVVKIPNRDGILLTVQRGETISTYVQRYRVPAAKLVAFNRLGSAAALRAGMRLFIPGENLRPATGSVAAATVATVVIPRRRAGFVWPVPGYSASGSGFGYRIHPVYGTRKWHNGLDIPAPTGTRVVAAKEGRVAFAGWISGYGRTIQLEHDNGIITYYAHLSSIGVGVGEYVEQGQLIGRVGASGITTGAHLHFEVRVGSEARDPVGYVGGAPAGARTVAAERPAAGATPREEPTTTPPAPPRGEGPQTIIVHPAPGPPPAPSAGDNPPSGSVAEGVVGQ